MYKLYYSPGSCSMAIHVLLNEIGEDFQLENTAIGQGKNKSEAFLKINPRGQVPALEEDGKAMFEGGAILAYLRINIPAVYCQAKVGHAHKHCNG